MTPKPLTPPGARPRGRGERVRAEVEVGELGDVAGRDRGHRQQHHAVDVGQQVGQQQPELRRRGLEVRGSGDPTRT